MNVRVYEGACDDHTKLTFQHFRFAVSINVDLLGSGDMWPHLFTADMHGNWGKKYRKFGEQKKKLEQIRL